MALAKRDDRLHTYADYCSWADDARYELIDGFAYAMAPAPSIAHQEMVLALAHQIADSLDASGCRPFVAPVDVRLPKQDAADERVDTVVQPDLLVVCDPSKIDARGISGAPDWIIEVVSPATAGHDQIVKHALYERHGMREYWLIHPIDRVLTIYRLVAGKYGIPLIQELVGTTPCGAVPAVTIDWARTPRVVD
ncbi:MAG: Uma2 family endonuclease [Burkholderiales bacterium]